MTNSKERFPTLNATLTDAQINNLARPLIRIVEEFYKDSENERKFQEWLKEQKDKSKCS